MNLCIFESHPVQYRAPVYRAVHQLCREAGTAKMRVFYATDAPLRGHFDAGFRRHVAWDEPLLEGYPVTVLHNTRREPFKSFRSLHGRGVFSALRQQRPDAVLLTNLAYEFDWAAYFGALALGIPIWLRVETQDEAFARSRMKSFLRRAAYRLAYSPVKKALVIGRLSARHFTKHGLDSTRQITTPYCVVDRFAEMSGLEKLDQRASLRRELGFRGETTVLLFCGKLQAKKNPLLIFDALTRLPVEEQRRFAVLYVGAGELEYTLRARARELSDMPVAFAGFKNQTELAPYYLASDVLVLPSQQMGETWGLVVNEALLAERRVIVSRHAGCHADFGSLPSVRVFDGTLDGLASALRNLPPSESTSGQREFMRAYSVESAAAGIALAMGIARPSFRIEFQSSSKTSRCDHQETAHALS